MQQKKIFERFLKKKFSGYRKNYPVFVHLGLLYAHQKINFAYKKDCLNPSTVFSLKTIQKKFWTISKKNHTFLRSPS